ncbi:uncharacterized protein K452DRAFT_314273 [Aplosporella prunicola CBS 121167]|uniref:Uncharacterized protein n=1 Tax=Aplosporella prunicola CBS 121167 TaxID=1176127 RepID=A0A6A6BSG9_9PEZI|nr:uncharacterized protein K452DRAFT_314273 [Aplosporella prunicola CBS 121167]KAF2147026.1 hypothetical protein K452DRAFT_314273 [Aplosporella prunicola CBS 121167]
MSTVAWVEAIFIVVGALLCFRVFDDHPRADDETYGTHPHTQYAPRYISKKAQSMDVPLCLAPTDCCPTDCFSTDCLPPDFFSTAFSTRTSSATTSAGSGIIAQLSARPAQTFTCPVCFQTSLPHVSPYLWELFFGLGRRASLYLTCGAIRRRATATIQKKEDGASGAAAVDVEESLAVGLAEREGE